MGFWGFGFWFQGFGFRVVWFGFGLRVKPGCGRAVELIVEECQVEVKNNK